MPSETSFRWNVDEETIIDLSIVAALSDDSVCKHVDVDYGILDAPFVCCTVEPRCKVTSIIQQPHNYGHPVADRSTIILVTVKYMNLNTLVRLPRYSGHFFCRSFLLVF